MSENMEFLSENLLNTTTMVVVTSGTGLVQYLFDRNRNVGYSTAGYASGTAAVLSIEFPSPTVVSDVLLQGTNITGLHLFYDSMTANALYSLTSYSGDHIYMDFASTTVSSLQLQMDTASGEKFINEMIVSNKVLTFERNPSSADYNPTIFRKQIEHEMPDGGRVLFNIRDKFRARLSWKFVTDTFHNQLLSVFEDAQPLYFVPFPTSTAWDGKAYEVVWSGEFDFKYSTNDKVQGYSGTINIKETPSG